MPPLTFEWVLGHVEAGGRSSLLMGNGFSRAFRDDIFNERADFGPREGPLRQLFERLDTFDFEAVMRLLEATETVLEIYGDNDELLNRICHGRRTVKLY